MNTKCKSVVIVYVCLILMILNALFYVNTYVTEKYEVQLIGIKKKGQDNLRGFFLINFRMQMYKFSCLWLYLNSHSF